MSHSSPTTHLSSLITHHSPLVLASGSAIRAQMLKGCGLQFSVVPSNVDEEEIKSEFVSRTSDFATLAKSLARAKALNVSAGYPDALTIGADQLCVLPSSTPPLALPPKGGEGEHGEPRGILNAAHQSLALPNSNPPLALPPKGGEGEHGEPWGVPKAADEKIRSFARELRQNLTNAETLLWSALRNKQLEGFRFRRQMPIEHYIVDFACLKPKLIIELDGGQHMMSQKDAVRDRFLEGMGFTVLRFWNNEVIDNVEGVLTVILHTLRRSPLPLKGKKLVGTIFDKPATRSGAIAQLEALQGKEHLQISAVCVARGAEVLWEHQERAVLTMRPLKRAEIEAYISADDPLKSCGAYKYESLGKHLFQCVSGNDDVIKGLPLQALIYQLHQMGAIGL